MVDFHIVLWFSEKSNIILQNKNQSIFIIILLYKEICYEAAIVKLANFYIFLLLQRYEATVSKLANFYNIIELFAEKSKSTSLLTVPANFFLLKLEE